MIEETETASAVADVENGEASEVVEHPPVDPFDESVSEDQSADQDEVQEVTITPPTPPDLVPEIPQPQSQAQDEAEETPMVTAAQKSATHGEPFVEETNTKKTVYAANQQSPLSHGSNGKRPVKIDMAGVPLNQTALVKRLHDIVSSNEAAIYYIHLIRNTPATWEGFKLTYGKPIEEMAVMSLPHLRQAVEELHGGGEYALNVINKNSGAQVLQLTLEIDKNRKPPIVPKNAEEVDNMEESGGYQRNVPNGAYYQNRPRPGVDPLTGMMTNRAGAVPSYATLGQGSAEITNAVQSERANKAKVLELKSQLELRKMEMQMEQMASGGKPGEVEALRAEMKSEMKDMLAGLKDLMAPKDNGNEVLAKAIETSATQSTESLKSMVAMMTAMMTTNNQNDNGSTAVAEAMKVSQAANDKIVNMALNGNNKMDKLLEVMFMKKLEAPESSLDTAMKFMTMGREQATEMVRMVQEFQGSQDDGDVIDPEAGFMGNLGNMALHALKNAAGGAARGGGTKIIEAIGSAMMKPAAPPAAPNTLAMPQAALPEPTQYSPNQPQFENASPQLSQPQQPQQPQQQPAQTQPVQGVPNVGDVLVEEVVELEDALTPKPDVPQQPVQQQPAQQQGVESMTAEAAARLREYVTEGMGVAIQDLNDGRRDHEWPEYALGKWNRLFLNQLAMATDDAQRVQLIQAACEPSVFQKVYEKITQDTTAAANFQTAMQSLLSEHNRGA